MLKRNMSVARRANQKMRDMKRGRANQSSESRYFENIPHNDKSVKEVFFSGDS